MASVYLTHEDVNSGSQVRVLCQSISISGKKNNQVKPDVNGDDIVEVHTQGFENPRYVCNNVYFTGAANTLTWDDVWSLYKAKYTGSNSITLNITYDTNTVLNGISTSTDISVILDTCSLNLDTSDSKDANRPIASLSFTETK